MMYIFGEQSIFSLHFLDENHGRKRAPVIYITMITSSHENARRKNSVPVVFYESAT
jgi:hypothetical protein